MANGPGQVATFRKRPAHFSRISPAVKKIKCVKLRQRAAPKRKILARMALKFQAKAPSTLVPQSLNSDIFPFAAPRNPDEFKAPLSTFTLPKRYHRGKCNHMTMRSKSAQNINLSATPTPVYSFTPASNVQVPTRNATTSTFPFGEVPNYGFAAYSTVPNAFSTRSNPLNVSEPRVRFNASREAGPLIPISHNDNRIKVVPTGPRVNRTVLDRTPRPAQNGAPNTDGFICPVCWELLCRPISLECGHTLCEKCFATYLNTQMENRTVAPSCPAGCQSILGYMFPKPNNVLMQHLKAMFPDEYNRRINEVRAHDALIKRIRYRVEYMDLQHRRRRARRALPLGRPGIALDLEMDPNENVLQLPNPDLPMIHVEMQLTLQSLSKSKFYLWLGAAIFSLFFVLHFVAIQYDGFRMLSQKASIDTRRVTHQCPAKSGLDTNDCTRDLSSIYPKSVHLYNEGDTKSWLFGSKLRIDEFITENIAMSFRSLPPFADPRTSAIYLLFTQPKLDNNKTDAFKLLYKPVFAIFPSWVPDLVVEIVIVLVADLIPLIGVIPLLPFKTNINLLLGFGFESFFVSNQNTMGLDLLIITFISLAIATYSAFEVYWKILRQGPNGRPNFRLRRRLVHVGYYKLMHYLIDMAFILFAYPILSNLFTYVFSWKFRLDSGMTILMWKMALIKVLCFLCFLSKLSIRRINNHPLYSQATNIISACLAQCLGSRLLTNYLFQNFIGVEGLRLFDRFLRQGGA